MAEQNPRQTNRYVLPSYEAVDVYFFLEKTEQKDRSSCIVADEAQFFANCLYFGILPKPIVQQKEQGVKETARILGRSSLAKRLVDEVKQAHKKYQQTIPF